MVKYKLVKYYFKKFFKMILWIVGVIILLALGLLIYVNLPVAKVDDSAQLGVTFSARYSHDIGLNWQENFIAILDDLKIKKIRIPVYWDLVEPKENEYDFSDVDWQLQEAKKRNAEIILSVGQKVPRWPECFVPEWTKDDMNKKKSALLQMILKTVERYKDDPTVKYWQVENEPFLNFGICPPADENLIDSEIALVRATDPTRKVIVTDSGELSLWYKAASKADIFGTTMYRTIYSNHFGRGYYWSYPIGPRFFQVKGLINKYIAHQDNNIVIELQAEPWIAGWTIDGTLEEQFKSMNPDQLKSNVEFARKVGFPEIYLWGAEWWYWLKVQKNHPELWDTARELYSHNQ